ncbi:hypothetical protein NBRC3222_2010 [Acetobacter pasteurianus NBRC 3222]|nr:hypothetical protein NBRC3222_2010 [Acetobacter pasteurianus NBRC 3222]
MEQLISIPGDIVFQQITLAVVLLMLIQEVNHFLIFLTVALKQMLAVAQYYQQVLIQIVSLPLHRVVL